MAMYKLVVTTGNQAYAGTWDMVYVTLVGSEGQSKRTELNNIGFDFSRGKTRTYIVQNSCSLGKLLLLRVEKDPFLIFPEDKWYCSKIVVTTPEDDTTLFPCYKWISRGEPLELRGGRATRIFEDNHQLLLEHRKNEIQQRKAVYQWKFYYDGLPHGFDHDNEAHLLAECDLSESRSTDSFDEKLKGMFKSKENWTSFEAMELMFVSKKTPMTDYVMENWKEDSFFGYQFLNGVNPSVIKRCTKIPFNFPVTNWTVKSFLPRGSSLQREMEIGNIFICDYKILEGIATRVVDQQALYVASGFCLFYLNCDKELLPIAIQLTQMPSPNNPIFLPTDSDSDWLLAKMFIKNADCLEHQGVQHLLKTHILGEVFAMATHRNLPSAHPIYKMLIPHFRTTIRINRHVHDELLGAAGSLSISSLGTEGFLELMRKGLLELKYSALCLPENITARGLDTIPNFYYRDDGLKLWTVLHSFVTEMTKYHYLSDEEVADDTELQDWVKDIFIHGVFGNPLSGFPEVLQTIDGLITFVTVVIFTVSAQHAVVNNGQFHYHSWIPNGSLLLVEPPPKAKDKSSMESVLKALPSVGETAILTEATWKLSYKDDDVVTLGLNPDEQFDESVPRHILRDLENELLFLSGTITERNSTLQVPYNYLNPPYVENSITI
ncbi:hydroperoxide isomerase ALOXE3-like [Eucyclogobius newberryi]|uniref:hydroperoxide isomerase ALOXE3-like n=1 Tax=Eucyclogobius newberryi TaxID=166745 RepID=UPI003B59F2F9